MTKKNLFEKKLFNGFMVLAAVTLSFGLALALTNCGGDDDDNNGGGATIDSKLVGTWEGTGSVSGITIEVKSNGTVTFGGDDGMSGSCSASGDTLTVTVDVGSGITSTIVFTYTLSTDGNTVTLATTNSMATYYNGTYTKKQ